MVATALNGTTSPNLSGVPIDVIAAGAVPCFIFLGQSGQLGGDYQWGNDGPGSYDSTVFSERGEVNLTTWDQSFNYGVFMYESGAVFDEFRARQEDEGGGFKANPSLYMARYLKSTLWKNRPIYSIFYAIGGTPISKFKNRGQFNEAMLNRIKNGINALIDAGHAVIPIICWNQGETQDVAIYGDLATSIANYATDLTYMLNELRHFLSVSTNNGNTVPLLVYKVPFDQTGAMTSPAHNEDINDQIVAAVAALPNAHIVDYSGKNVYDNTHVTALGQIEALAEFDTAFRGITTFNVITGKIVAVPAIAAHYDSTRGVTETSGAVSEWQDQTANKLHVVQATSANQPTISGTTVTFDGVSDSLVSGAIDYTLGVRQLATYDLPDAGGGAVGEGFTCTGITYAPNTGTWWLGDDGRDIEGDTSQTPHLVQLTADFSEVVSEIDLSSIVTSGTVQGVTYDTSDNTIWFAAVNDGKIYHVNTSGTLLDTITMTAPSSGITYNANNDSIYQTDDVTGTLYEWSCSTLSSLGTTALPSAGQDQIFYDADNDILWWSLGANNTAGQVVGYNLGTSTAIPALELTAADAIEGIYIDTANNRMYVCSDGYYHITTTGKNRVIEYEFGPDCGVEMWMVGNLTGSPSGTDCLMAFSDPLDATPTSNNGIAVYSPSSTTIVRIIYEGDENSHVSQNVNVTSGTALTTAKAVIRIKFDLYNCIYTLFYNGTSQGTAAIGISGLRSITGQAVALGASVIPDRNAPLALDAALIMQKLLTDDEAVALNAYLTVKYSV